MVLRRLPSPVGALQGNVSPKTGQVRPRTHMYGLRVYRELGSKSGREGAY